MTEIERLKEWRAEEIVKLFLLRLNIGLVVEISPVDQFDFIVSLKDNVNIRFAIEVKSTQRFNKRLNIQIKQLEKYSDQRLITMPILIIKVDDIKEVGEIDFLVYPSVPNRRLLIRSTYRFKTLNKSNFNKKVEIIKKWYSFIELENKNNKPEETVRFINDEILRKLAVEEIDRGFLNKAVVAYIEIISIQDYGVSNFTISESLINFIKIKKYLEHCTNIAKTVIMTDHDPNIIIEEIDFPMFIPLHNSFILFLPLDSSNQQRILATVFSVMGTALEILNVSIQNGFAVRGGIDYDDTYISKDGNQILGAGFNNAKTLSENLAETYRILISNNIKKLIKENLKVVNPTIFDYFKRYIYKDIDSRLALNPALILAYSPEIANHSLSKIYNIIDNLPDKKTINNYKPLLEKVKNQDLGPSDISIFD